MYKISISTISYCALSLLCLIGSLSVYEAHQLEQNSNNINRIIDPYQWNGVGANVGRNIINTPPHNIIVVNSSAALLRALKMAERGVSIELIPGIYDINVSRINISFNGELDNPIRVFSRRLGGALIMLKGEGIVIDKPYWQFENLHFMGKCNQHKDCEHAFHVVGKGQNAKFINNIFQDFNAAIKVNGFKGDYPDQGKVIGNTFYNKSVRKTSNPVTPIDIMHANNWLISENFIFDFIKSEGNKISYGAFVKGGSSYSVFSRNLIMCNANLRSTNVAIGLSLGGGGSSILHHRNSVKYEHSGGIIRNNIIMNCAEDVGIYLNKAHNSFIHHNILHNTQGIDVRFKESTADLHHNILSGGIYTRDGAHVEKYQNIINEGRGKNGKALANLFSPQFYRRFFLENWHSFE